MTTVGRRAVTRQLAVALAITLAGWLAALPAHAQTGAAAPVQGQIVSRARGPVPGLTVYLVHPTLGRSAPSYTDKAGRFGWTAIPIRRDAYFLEVYWGRNLVYRQQVQVQGPTQLPPLTL